MIWTTPTLKAKRAIGLTTMVLFSASAILTQFPLSSANPQRTS